MDTFHSCSDAQNHPLPLQKPAPPCHFAALPAAISVICARRTSRTLVETAWSSDTVFSALPRASSCSNEVQCLNEHKLTKDNESNNSWGEEPKQPKYKLCLFRLDPHAAMQTTRTWAPIVTIEYSCQEHPRPIFSGVDEQKRHKVQSRPRSEEHYFAAERTFWSRCSLLLWTWEVCTQEINKGADKRYQFLQNVSNQCDQGFWKRGKF